MQDVIFLSHSWDTSNSSPTVINISFPEGTCTSTRTSVLGPLIYILASITSVVCENTPSLHTSTCGIFSISSVFILLLKLTKFVSESEFLYSSFSLTPARQTLTFKCLLYFLLTSSTPVITTMYELSLDVIVGQKISLSSSDAWTSNGGMDTWFWISVIDLWLE